jgi:hypothetical protein
MKISHKNKMGVLKRSPLFMQKSGSISLKKGCEK